MTIAHRLAIGIAPLLFVACILSLTYIARAASIFDISYPVEALGGCASQGECKAYCDAPEHELQCVRWAEDNGFTTRPEGGPDSGKSDADILRDEEALANAPGACKTPRECDAYCRVEAHFDECLDYSVTYGYATAEEAAKIRAQAARGGPGGCKSENECNTYCRTPAHARECMDFVVKEGKITQEEADLMVSQMELSGGRPLGNPSGKGAAEPKIKEKRVREILEDKKGPGGCTSMQECAAYCQSGDHIDECLAFAEANGIMEPEELAKAKRFSALGGPGGCKSADECEAFCRKSENSKICLEFSRDNGLLSEEEASMMEKQMQIIQKMSRPVGPGECASQDECNRYCSDQAHLEECVDFARKQGGGLSDERVNAMMGRTQDAAEKMRQLEKYQRERVMDRGGDSMQSVGAPDGSGRDFFDPGRSGRQIERRDDGGSGYSDDVHVISPGDQRYGPPAGFENMMPGSEGRMGPPEGFEYRPDSDGRYGPPDGFDPRVLPQGGMPPEGMQFPQEYQQTQPTSMSPFGLLGAAVAPFFDFLFRW